MILDYIIAEQFIEKTEKGYDGIEMWFYISPCVSLLSLSVDKISGITKQQISMSLKS